jgi:hypothetical protein
LWEYSFGEPNRRSRSAAPTLVLVRDGLHADLASAEEMPNLLGQQGVGLPVFATFGMFGNVICVRAVG